MSATKRTTITANVKFFTPLPEHKLSCGQYYSLKLKTLDEYKMLLETFDNHGTTDGRPDA